MQINLGHSVRFVVCWLLNVPAKHAATLRLKLQIKLSLSPILSILTAGQAVPALTLQITPGAWQSSQRIVNF